MMMIKIKRLRLMTTMTMMTTTAHWSCYPIVHSLMGLPTTPFDFQTPSLAKFRSTTFLLSTMVKIIIWTLNIKAASRGCLCCGKDWIESMKRWCLMIIPMIQSREATRPSIVAIFTCGQWQWHHPDLAILTMHTAVHALLTSHNALLTTDYMWCKFLTD